MNATDHSAMTRPRICGAVANCRVEFPIDRNETLQYPTRASATNATLSTGARAAKTSATPKATEASTMARRPVRPRAAVTKPPTTAPIPMAAVITPNVSAPPSKTCLANTGNVTWNS